jgi:hypothetical protein
MGEVVDSVRAYLGEGTVCKIPSKLFFLRVWGGVRGKFDRADDVKLIIGSVRSIIIVMMFLRLVRRRWGRFRDDDLWVRMLRDSWLNEVKVFQRYPNILRGNFNGTRSCIGS